MQIHVFEYSGPHGHDSYTVMAIDKITALKVIMKKYQISLKTLYHHYDYECHDENQPFISN